MQKNRTNYSLLLEGKYELPLKVKSTEVTFAFVFIHFYAFSLVLIFSSTFSLFSLLNHFTFFF